MTRTLVHSQQLVLFLGKGNKLIGFLSGGGEGFLANNYSGFVSAREGIDASDCY